MNDTPQHLTAARPRQRKVVMYAYHDAQILDITGPLEVFGRTARWLRDRGLTADLGYRVEIIADEKGLIRTSSGMQLYAERSFRDMDEEIDTLLISGGPGHRAAMENTELLEWIRGYLPKTTRLGSVCNGALILAKAGLLEGRKATTHWDYCDELREESEDIEVIDDAIHTRDGKIYTSAGVTAGMDLALAMVEEDWGSAVALATAQELVMFLKRPGGQSQFSRHLEAQILESDGLGLVVLWMLERLDGDLGVAALAQKAALSERHFARRFRAEMGMTPGRYVEIARVEAARRKLEATQLSIKLIAVECGFSSPEIMRRAFQRILGVPPNGYRTRFQSSQN